MADRESSNSWVQIRQGVADVERLIGQKQYNLAMVRSRQTLEYMVKCLSSAAGVRADDLSDAIDELYKKRIITRNTCEHYHKIRMIGNKATHEGDSTASNANTAYHLLSQEVYTFANSYATGRPKATAPARSASGQRSASAARSAESSRNAGARAAGSGRPQGAASGRSQGQGSGRPSSQRRSSGAQSFSLGNITFTPDLLFKILIPILVVIILVALIKIIGGGKKNTAPKKEETKIESVEETPAETIPETIPETTAPAETEPQAPKTYVTTAGVRVRSTPDTGSDTNILGVLNTGTEIQYIGDYDGTWAIVNYNGSEAYMSKQYLKEQ